MYILSNVIINEEKNEQKKIWIFDPKKKHYQLSIYVEDQNISNYLAFYFLFNFFFMFLSILSNKIKEKDEKKTTHV